MYIIVQKAYVNRKFISTFNNAIITKPRNSRMLKKSK